MPLQQFTITEQSLLSVECTIEATVFKQELDGTYRPYRPYGAIPLMVGGNAPGENNQGEILHTGNYQVFLQETPCDTCTPSYTLTPLINAVSVGSGGVPVDSYSTEIFDLTTPNTYTIVPGTDLVSWSVRLRSGTTSTVTVNGGSVLTMDVNETLTSGNVEEDKGILTDVVDIDSGDGIVRVTILRRV